jgi:hypothetical protein
MESITYGDKFFYGGTLLGSYLSAKAFPRVGGVKDTPIANPVDDIGMLAAVGITGYGVYLMWGEPDYIIKLIGGTVVLSMVGRKIGDMQ